MSDTKILRMTAFLISGEHTLTFEFDKPSDFLEEIPDYIRGYDDYDIPCDLIVIEERDCRPRYREHIFPFNGAMELVEFVRGIQFQLHYIDDYEMPTVDWDGLGCGELDDVQKDNTIQRNKSMLKLFHSLLARACEDNGAKDVVNVRLFSELPDTVGIRFSFGTVTFFNNGTWKLEE